MNNKNKTDAASAACFPKYQVPSRRQRLVFIDSIGDSLVTFP